MYSFLDNLFLIEIFRIFACSWMLHVVFPARSEKRHILISVFLSAVRCVFGLYLLTFLKAKRRSTANITKLTFMCTSTKSCEVFSNRWEDKRLTHYIAQGLQSLSLLRKLFLLWKLKNGRWFVKPRFSYFDPFSISKNYLFLRFGLVCQVFCEGVSIWSLNKIFNLSNRNRDENLTFRHLPWISINIPFIVLNLSFSTSSTVFED